MPMVAARHNARLGRASISLLWLADDARARIRPLVSRVAPRAVDGPFPRPTKKRKVQQQAADFHR